MQYAHLLNIPLILTNCIANIDSNLCVIINEKKKD